MFGKAVRKCITNKKWSKQSNPSQYLKRIERKSNLAIKDLTLIAEKLDEKQLGEIFTPEKLGPLIIAILDKKNLRSLEINEMFANRVYQKLINDLHPDMANQFSSDIGKSWFIAQMAVAYWDKPFSGKNISIQS